MNPEERSLLERTYKLSQENNTILRSLQRSRRIGIIFKSFYWFIIIGLSIGAFYFIQPYINFVSGAFGGNSDSSNANSISPAQSYVENIRELLK
jgi:hypothetical protein